MLFGGILFAILLCFKHIYLYLAPAYFVYLLRAYCLSKSSIFRIRWLNCVQLGAGIAIVFGAAFGPFAYWGEIDQLLSRLFPFSRGLCHAYWAPNIWAMYSFTDRVLLFGKQHPEEKYGSLLTFIVAPKFGLPVDQNAVSSVTRGLIGDSSFAVLPNISPETTFVLTLFFQIVSDSTSPPTILSCSYLAAMSDQALLATKLGAICWRSDPMWVRVLSVRLACP